MYVFFQINVIPVIKFLLRLQKLFTFPMWYYKSNLVKYLISMISNAC